MKHGQQQGTIEAADGTENTLTDTESNNDESGNADAENAVIKCKDGSQVVLCGAGTLNIQANGKNGIKSGATTDDGEASLTIRDLTLNIFGGTITAHSDSGDGFDSNGDLTISGGSVTVWTANAADNEPLDADGTVTISGGTVLAAGGSGGMGMSLAAAQSCVIFGGTTGMPDGNMQNGQPDAGGQPNGKEPPSGEERPDGEDRPAQGGFGGASLLTQGGSFTIANSDGAALYTGEAAYNASFVFFSSADLSDGESYMLTSGETQTESAAQVGTVSIGMGSMGGPGGQKPDGTPPSGGFGGQKPDGSTPPEKPEGEDSQNNGSDAKA